MKKFLSVFLMAFLACASAQSCNNPLLDIYGVAGLQNPVPGAGSPYCGNLQNGNTCCSNSTVLELQNMITNLQNTLQALAGERDIYIAQLDHNYTSEYQNKVSDLTDLTDEIGDIQNANSAVGDPIHTQFLSLRELGNHINDLSDDDDFKKKFVDMQNKRVVCFNTLLQIQAEAYCLACDPNWATQGVADDGTITSAPQVCQTIQDACAPYTAAMDKFNPLFQGQQSYQRLVNLINYLKVFREHNSILNATISGDIPVVENPTQRTNSQPEGCNDGSCEWQCSNLFDANFLMNTDVAGNGAGIIGGGDYAFQDLGVLQIPAGGARRLQDVTNTWNPDLANSGMTIVVLPDPAAVTNLKDGDSASDANIDPHLGGSRIGFGLALAVVLINVIFM